MKHLCLMSTVALITLITLGACTRVNDFTPAAGATAEDNFLAACADCHQSKGDHIYELDEAMSDKAAIAMKISKGSLAMPSFPNIQGQPLIDLATYVQLQSRRK